MWLFMSPLFFDQAGEFFLPAACSRDLMNGIYLWQVSGWTLLLLIEPVHSFRDEYLK